MRLGQRMAAAIGIAAVVTALAMSTLGTLRAQAQTPP